MEKYAYGDESQETLALQYSTKPTRHGTDYSRRQTTLIYEIKERTKEKSYTVLMQDIKEWFMQWKQQYNGLTLKEALLKFMYSVSHTGVSIATVVYCIVMLVIVGSVVFSNYVTSNSHREFYLANEELLALVTVAILGLISILFHMLPLVLLFDYASFCLSLGLVIGSCWRIANGYTHPHVAYSSLVTFGLIMMLMAPFRMFWWFKYYPNRLQAMQLYSKLSAQGLLQQIEEKEDEENDDSDEDMTESEMELTESLFEDE
mmetsp:Transcript_5174/g.8706  ORF Transcript_5174/g.8706 Transcript_5174/m.8706 type:complete len:260 (+) Transcript_5174:30-809(+)